MSDQLSLKIFKIFNGCFLIFIVFITLFPFINVLAVSFSSESYIVAGSVSLLPKGFNTHTYNTVMSDPMFWINYKNTVIYTILATGISMFITTICAYALSKKHLKGRQYILGFVVFTMFFGGGLIPNFLLVRSLGLLNTIWAIVLPGAMSVWNMLIMKSFFESMPEELEEAAAVDGLNTYGILIKMILPLSKAVLATIALFYAVGNWNSWFGAFLYLDKRDLFPVSIYLRNLLAGAATGTSIGGAEDMASLAQVEANVRAVTIILTTLPILTIYPFIQKYFVTGIMMGSIKQ